MNNRQQQKLFRDKKGHITSRFSSVDDISYKQRPLDFLFVLARYKFAARLVRSTDHVLDAGCGDGIGSVFLSKFAKHVTSVDYDEELIENNKKTYKDILNIDFKKLDLLNVSSRKATYDAVVSMDVIEHFNEEEGKKLAANYAKLTNEGGFVLIGTPNIASRLYASKNRLKTYLHEFTPDELQSLLSNYFKRVFLFSMTDEIVSTSFPKMAWYLMALCIK